MQRRLIWLLVAAFGVLSLGGDGCFDWATSSPPYQGEFKGRPLGCGADSKPPGDWYTCQRQLAPVDPAENPMPACKSPPILVCVPQADLPSATVTETEAEAKAEYLATAIYAPVLPGYKVLVMTCQRGYGGNYNPLVPTPPGEHPQDDPTCSSVTPVPPGNCFAGSDTCTSCLNGCCTEYAACVTAGVQADCDAMVNYWQGTGPATSSGAQQVQDLNFCFQSLGCGSVSVCTQYLRLHDGGLGFGGGYP